MKKSVWIVAAALPLLLAGCGEEGGGGDLGAVSGKPATAGPEDLPPSPDGPTASAPAPAPSSPAPSLPAPSSPAPSPQDGENTEIKREDAPDNIDCTKVVADDAASLSGAKASGSEFKFGQARTWKGKLTVAISTPKAYNPTPQAAGVEGEGSVAMRMTVTIRNEASAAYDMSQPWEVFTSAGADSSQIFDVGQCLEGSPSESLAKGKSTSYMLAWVVKDPNSMKLEFDPGLDLDPITFTN